jgi:serine/threonine protein kinase
LIEPETQSLKLCDFGSAKLITKPHEVSVPYISTRFYRAPELLLNNENYGLEVDLWAIGCVMAEALRNGHPLFEGTSNADMLVQIF